MITLGTHAMPLRAQSAASVGVGAGVAIPVGTTRDETNPGLRALAALNLDLPGLPASLRIDAAYDRLGFKSTSAGAAGSETGARTIASGALGLSLIAVDSQRVVWPYAIAGVGINRLACTGRSDCDTSTQLGWNAGVGARLGLFALRGFAEARLHCIPRSVSDFCYIPVTLAVLF